MEFAEAIVTMKRKREGEVINATWSNELRVDDAEGFELLIGFSLAAQLHATDSASNDLPKKRSKTKEEENTTPTIPIIPEQPLTSQCNSPKQEDDDEEVEQDDLSEGYTSEGDEEEEEGALFILQESAKVEESNQKEEDWLRCYNRLKQFKEINDTLNVPSKVDKGLAAWIKHQRKEGTKRKLSQEQLQMLLELGFQWNTSRISKHSWEEKFQKLKEFQQANGHCKVPLKLDRQLNSWVDAQRQANKQGRLSEDRIKKLESLGVQWIVKSWESKYKKLKEFKETNGHCNVPLNTEKQLYRWVVDQRRANKRGKLSKERIKKLEDLGIRLTSKKDIKQPSSNPL